MKERNGKHTEIHREEDYVKIETELGIFYLQAKEHQELLAATRNESSLRYLRRNQPFRHLEFGLLDSRTVW